MSQYFEIHPVTPQARLLRQAVRILDEGGVIVYPTDSCYALGCHLGDKAAAQRIRRIRDVDHDHNFTLVCRDLSEIATYARISKADYRLLKTHTPGPYTFILKATHEVPRRLQHPKRRTIGLRVPDHAIAQALLESLGQPLMSSTLILPGDELPMTDPEAIRARLEHDVDLVIGGGNCGLEPTTVVRLDDDRVEVERHGRGPVEFPHGPLAQTARAGIGAIAGTRRAVWYWLPWAAPAGWRIIAAFSPAAVHPLGLARAFERGSA